jgi:hypothetical protein
MENHKESDVFSAKLLDPFYWYLRIAHRRLFKAELKKEERAFIAKNINKHRLIQWLNLLAAIFVFYTLQAVSPDKIGTVITALIAPVMVMGTAWFAISFGAIPARLIELSLEITFWVYLAFKLSLTVMFLAIGVITPALLWPVLILIYIAIDFSCAQYDTCDGLKAGLDEALLKHSRAAIIYYKDQGVDIDLD